MANDELSGKPIAPASSHRLPTVSASQALFATKKQDGEHNITFGLNSLDALLQGRQGQDAITGLPRGRVTEIYGPPGSGKTALCLQAAANALLAGDHVVWIDGATPLPIPCLSAILIAKSPSTSSSPASSSAATPPPLTRLTHLTTPTLSHLLALLLAPPTAFPPPATTLIILSSLSTLLELAYPRQPAFSNFTSSSISTSADKDNQKWLQNRRTNVLGTLANNLAQLAATRNVAVLVTNDVMTKVRRGEEAMLVPVLGQDVWVNVLGARVVTWADWAPVGGRVGSEKEGEARRKVVRYAGVVKAVGGTEAGGGEGSRVVPFIVTSTGVEEVVIDGEEVLMSPESRKVMARVSAGNARKRNHEQVADSDEDASSEYGWEDDEDPLCAAGLVDQEVVVIE